MQDMVKCTISYVNRVAEEFRMDYKPRSSNLMR